jgi:hypothetical protein
MTGGSSPASGPSASATGARRAGVSLSVHGGSHIGMATERQKEAARRNLEKARQAHRARSHGRNIPKQSPGLSTAEQNRLSESQFAFPEERKEPLTDAGHVRNAIARFDQVEGVTDTERDKAWKRIQRAAKRFGVEVSESDWHELFEGGKAHKH